MKWFTFVHPQVIKCRSKLLGMNKPILAISVITLVAVVMILGTVSQAMAAPPIQSGKVKPHKLDHFAGSPPEPCTVPSGNTGELWFIDNDNDNFHDSAGSQEQTFCLRPKA